MLYRDYLRYLAQPMPDISGIFTTGAAQPFIQPQPDGLEQVQEQIDMLERYPIAYQPYMGGGGEGGYQDEDTTIGDGSTLGIDSFGNLVDFGKKNIGTIASTLAFGPVPTLIGKGVLSLVQNQKDQKAAAAAKAKATAIAIEQANRQAERERGAAAAAAAAQAAANREARRSSQYGGGGGGSSVGGTGSAAAADTSQGETGYGSCFIAGTKVTMADGTLKNIEDIKVGDIVKGHKGNNEVIKLDPTLLGERKLYSFNDNEHYFFTSEHPFMTEEGWKSIKPEKTKERDGIELYNQLKGELKIGDKLVTEKGLIEIKEIKSKEMNYPKMPLYNFNVSNDNSYIADGYVVHNKGGGGDGCFLKGTLVTMLDGSKKEIQEIDLGDEVAKGGKVFATGKFLVNNLYDYKGIKVSGSHMVFEEGNWTRVEDSKYGKALGDEEHTVYVFGCENRRILIEDVLFTDYFEVKEQDKLIEDEKEFFDNWKSFARKDSKDNLTIINAA